MPRYTGQWTTEAIYVSCEQGALGKEKAWIREREADTAAVKHEPISMVPRPGLFPGRDPCSRLSWPGPGTRRWGVWTWVAGLLDASPGVVLYLTRNAGAV